MAVLSVVGTTPDEFTPLPVRRKDLAERRVESEAVVLDRRSKRIHQLNEAAFFVWERCDGEHTLEQISNDLAASFHIEPRVAARDVEITIRRLEALDLLESSAGSELAKGS